MRRAATGAVLALAMAAAPALAQDSRRHWERCENEDKVFAPDLQIGSCTALVQAGGTAAQMSAALNNRGNAYSDKGQFDRAIQDYDQAIRLDPNNGLAFCNRGSAHHRQGRFDLAIQDYGQAIGLYPNFVLAHFNRGIAYHATRRLPQAIADYEAVLRIRPKEPYALYGRGVARQMMGDAAAGDADIAAALAIDPKVANDMARRDVTP